MNKQRFEVEIFLGKNLIATQIVEAEEGKEAEEKVEKNFELKFKAKKSYAK